MGAIVLVLAACAPVAQPAITTRPPLWEIAEAPAAAVVARAASEWVRFEAPEGKKILAAVYRPQGNGPFPVLLFLHGDAGLRPVDLEFAARFADVGFVTLAACWFWDPQSFFNCPDAPAPARDSRASAVKNITALLEGARTLRSVNSGRLGVIGHSGGAFIAVLTASRGGTIEALVSISGPLGAGVEPVLLDEVERLRPPLMIVHGTGDARVPMKDARAYETAARQRGKTIEALYVEGAPHELTAASTWTADVHGRVVSFLEEHLIR